MLKNIAKICAIGTLLLIPFFAQSTNQKSAEFIANQVVTKMYQTNGNFLLPKPKVQVIQNVSNVARLLRLSNTIELDYKTYILCQTMGKDSLSALAFILGHELAHVFQLDAIRNEASFLSYTKNNKFSQEEEQADLYGAFLAHLSGFKTKEILPQLIEQIYVQYDLKNKALPNYPTFEERQQTGRQLARMIEQMQQIYETANYAIVAEKYELAVMLLENLEMNYKGKELYNNLGVVYTLYALSLQKTNQDNFIYPIELDASFRLKKPKTSRGDDDKTYLKQIDKYYKKANSYFETAAKMDLQYLSPNINTACVLLLQNKNKEALDYIFKKQMEKRARFSDKRSAHLEKTKLIKALALAKAGAINDPNELLLALSNDDNNAIATIAKHNLKVLNKETIETQNTTSSTCNAEAVIPANIKIYKLPKIGDWTKLQQDYSINTTQKEDELQVFIKQNQQLIFSFYRKNEASQTIEIQDSNAIVLSSNGYFIHCSEQQQIVQQGENKRIIHYYKTSN